MNARQAHRKSRNGCTQCKTRKVKCNEAIPCMRCVKRGDKCSFLTSSVDEALPTPASIISSTAESSSTPASTTGRTPVSLAAPQDEAFTITDIELFHRFTTVTCHYLANPNRSSPWLNEIPALSIKHPFLLHEIMALAAIDLGRDTARSHSASTAYLELARHHHAHALSGLMSAITANNATLVAPVWACNSLFVPYYFATAADTASLLFTSEPRPGPAEWMLPLRGGVTLWKSNEDVLLSGAMGHHLKPYRQNLRDAYATKPYTNPSEAVIMAMVGQLQLHGALEEEDERRVMMEAFRLLRHCFRMSDRDDALARKTASLTFCATAPEEFFAMLAQRRPGPLVVMAYWCVLLHRAEKEHWWMCFKSDRLNEMLELIAEMLGSEGRELILWPLEQFLGPPFGSEARSTGDKLGSVPGTLSH